jgi:DNA polymerase-1
MPSGTAPGATYLIDAHSLIFQVFHAIPRMSSPSGLPTNALFGFARDLLFVRGLRPEYLVCAFDRAEPTFRSEIYAEYKAHREAMPDDLQLQLPHIHRLLEALSIPAVSHPRFEADDVLATIAVAATARGQDVFLCTSDKDCRQLIDGHVRLFNLRKRQEFGRAELLADWGITPEQVVDLQTLVGDPVDNVRGVPGIGIKTAAKLLQEFGTLENVLANIDKIAGKKRQESLREAVKEIPRTRELVRLATDVPIKLDWDAWRQRDVDVEKFLALCREWGFHSFANQVRNLSVAGVPSPAAEDREPVQGELFPFGANAPSTETTDNGQRTADQWKATYHLVDTPKKSEAFFKQLRKQKRIAIDLETTSLSPLEAEIVGIAISWKPGEAWYLALRGPEGAAVLDPEKTLERLRDVLESPAVAKVNQNIKYDLLVLRGRGVSPQGVAGDPMVADYLLHAGERSHNLEELARRYLNHQVIPITDLIGKKNKKQPQLRMDQVPTARVAEYAGEDADVAWRLCEHLEPELEKPVAGGPSPLRKLYDDLEVPLIEVLAELEYNGIRLDIPYLRRLGEEMGWQLTDIENEIYALAGHPFNIGSLVQLRKVLFDELKLPVQGRTGVTGAASTDQETLEKLAALEHPGSALPRKILEYRQLSKLKGTYVDALPEMVNPRTGRVHASFNQTVAATGRLSSSDPNLQNIPVRREQGQQIRRAFLPAEGWRLLTADYSQVELRLLAHFCGDETLKQAFAEDRDVHAAVASEIFGVPQSEVTGEMRRMAKTVNFGVIYGISGHGLAQRLHIKRDEANRFIDAYFARYPRVLDYQARLLDECRRTGYVSTILGRRRRFDTGAIRANSTYQQRNSTEREAINMEIQGSAADLLKLAMLNLYRRLRESKLKARMLLTVHDELVFEVPPKELDAVAELAATEMTTALELSVPLKVDLAAGSNWLEVEEFEVRGSESGVRRAAVSTAS